MIDSTAQSQTFVEMVLTLLEDRFPWLGHNTPVSGADTVDELSDLHHTLVKARRRARRKASHRR